MSGLIFLQLNNPLQFKEITQRDKIKEIEDFFIAEINNRHKMSKTITISQHLTMQTRPCLFSQMQEVVCLFAYLPLSLVHPLR